MVEVTQVDIEAADRFDLHWYADFDKAQAEALAQAFARHREAAVATAQAEAERDKLAGIVQGWHYLAVGPDEMGDYYTHKQLVKLSEPYASPAIKAPSERKP